MACSGTALAFSIMPYTDQPICSTSLSVPVVPNWNTGPLRDFLILFTHSVGLLWTSDQPIAEASTYTQYRKTRTNIHALSGIQTQITATKRLRPQRHTARPLGPVSWFMVRCKSRTVVKGRVVLFLMSMLNPYLNYSR
jgi:hypothetical protein